MKAREIPADPSVIRAAQWLSEQRQLPQPIAYTLHLMFGITHTQAAQASAMASKFVTLRKAFG